jgi:hypothetical protein
MDYFLENENKLSKREDYILASLANEVQYQMRCLKERISGVKINNIENGR